METDMAREIRICNSCGTKFECFASATKRHCTPQCGSIGRSNAHHMIHTSEYSAWRDMKARCYRTTHKDYVKYGARGITVCDRWRNSFQNFYADLGPKPEPRLSIERVNNNGNYEPDNCKWATQLEQSRNRRPWHEWNYKPESKAKNKPSSSRALHQRGTEIG